MANRIQIQPCGGGGGGGGGGWEGGGGAVGEVSRGEGGSIFQL